MIDGASHHGRQLCQIASWETDQVKLLERIVDARNAVLDRIEDGFTKSRDGEQGGVAPSVINVRQFAQN
jgi:hypothetical protein